eukprot:14295948-Ditylum_brightwellii.AAC.1
MEEIGFEWTVSRQYLGVKGDQHMNLALVAKYNFLHCHIQKHCFWVGIHGMKHIIILEGNTI